MSITVKRIEARIVTLPRDEPYLGPLGPGERVNERGYVVRAGNRTIYPTVDRTVLVKLTASDGTVGWGETYGIVAPLAVLAIIDDVFVPIVTGRAPDDPAALYAELYDLMRVRGASGGYYGDALAAIDIALWDLKAKLAGVPLSTALGGARTAKIPVYVSGLPKATLAERVALAQQWVDKGFRAVKYAAVVSHEGVVEEMAALRHALGPDVDLMVDLHWQYTAAEAQRMVLELSAFEPYFVEAPCAPEDIDGLTDVAATAPMAIAAGEEWRNVFEAAMRIPRTGIRIVQPEMGHTGVSQFMAIAALAQAHGVAAIPHATIGVGIFMAASLHAAATLPHCPLHEYQPSVFDHNLAHVETTMRCAAGYYTLPDGVGLGTAPKPSLWDSAGTSG